MLLGPVIQDVLNSAHSTTITVGAGATVYSRSFSLKNGDYFAMAWKAASAGAIDLTIQLEQATRLPTTEGSSDTGYTVPEGMPDIDTNLNDANWHSDSLSPVALPYGRLKITSAAGVANTLQVKFSMQEAI